DDADHRCGHECESDEQAHVDRAASSPGCREGCHVPLPFRRASRPAHRAPRRPRRGRVIHRAPETGPRRVRTTHNRGMTADATSGLGRFLTIADTAEILNISAGQAYALVRSGELPAIKLGEHGQWRIERHVLEAYIAARYEEARRKGLWHQAEFTDLPELFVCFSWRGDNPPRS